MTDNNNKIAIIGFSGALPGVDSIYNLWKLTSTGGSGIKRTDNKQLSKNLPDDIVNHKNFIPFGGGPSNFKNFDANFFGYSPKEAKYLDPQIRKALEYSWHAFENAGYYPGGINTLVGVYMSSSVNSYFLENLGTHYHKYSNEQEKNQIIFLNESDFLASRIAYHFNFKGPAFTLKCGCSSSLVSVHHACNGLNNFDCDVALAGGVAIKPRYNYGYVYEQGGILSKDGYCRPFAEKASGTVFTNGIGFVVLKRLNDAIDDEDTIYGVIRSSAINNDGNDKVGYMAPSISGQIACMETALAYAELNPRDINYVETHGTGTEIGDPIEYEGLRNVFADCPQNSIALSSVKGNIGHLDAASGIAGLIKVLLDLKNKTISPIANFNGVNPKLNSVNSPLELVTTLREWVPGASGRIAAISSFGIGGTNANIILEEYNTSTKSIVSKNKFQSYLFVFSAKNQDSLLKYIKNFQQYLSDTPTIDLSNVSYTLLVGRKSFNYRYAVLANDTEELITKLDNVTQNDFKKIETQKEILLTENTLLDAKALFRDWISGGTIKNSDIKISGYRRVSIPLYQFADDEYWIYTNEYTKCSNQKISDIAQWFYVPDWKLMPTPVHHSNITNKKILFLSNGNNFCQKLIDALGSDTTHITIHNIDNFDITQKAHWVSLWQKLKDTNSLPDIVIHAWCLTEQNDSLVYDINTLGIFSLVYLYQASIQVTGNICFVTSIIANQLFNVSGCEYVDPLKATLLGVSQVLPKEYEHASCQLIDIDLNYVSKANIALLLDEIKHGKNCEIALRNTKRFVRAYSKINLSQENLNHFVIETKKNYLILGGLGNFGIELAEFIGVLHGGNVFLTSRMNFPEKESWDQWLEEKGPNNSISQKILTLKLLISKGANITILKADVTNNASLQNIQSYINSHYGNIAGIIHAAGIVDSGMIQNKTIDSLRSVFAAKIEGTQNICNTFLNDNLEFLILCSSMNSIIGGLGQIDNTAANAYVDSYAEYCVNNGYHNVLAINWGAVNEARARNYSTLPQFAELSQEHIKNKMTKQEIFDVYRRIFSSKLSPRIIVSTINFNEVIRNWSKVGSLQELIKNTDIHKKSREVVTTTDYKKPQDEFESFIANLWQNLLGIETIGLNDDFFQLGGNSLIAIQCIGSITAKYPIKVHAMSIYEYPSLDKFASYIRQSTLESIEKQKLMEV